jgi:hypothetical protein
VPTTPEPARSVLDDPLYEVPRAQPVRFPPTDRAHRPGEPDPAPAVVPEPTESPEAARTETPAPNPYL